MNVIIMLKSLINCELVHKFHNFPIKKSPIKRALLENNHIKQSTKLFDNIKR